jgi:hypothetical protein
VNRRGEFQPGQIAPGQWAGSDQGIAGLALPPPSGMPNGPRRKRTGRYRSALGFEGAPPADIFDESRYAELNGETTIPVGIASVSVLAQPASLRNMLGFRNVSAAATSVILISFGAPATLRSWLRLAQNEMILFDDTIPQDDIYAICADASGLLTFVQSTTPGSS